MVRLKRWPGTATSSPSPSSLDLRETPQDRLGLSGLLARLVSHRLSEEKGKFMRKAQMSGLIPITMIGVLITDLLGSSAQGAIQYSVTLLNPDGIYTRAYGMNDAGQVVGAIWSSPAHAFLYQNGVKRDLGSIGSGASSAAYAINARGQVAGYSVTNSRDEHAAIFAGNGLVQDLGTLGGFESIAWGINDSGQAVGRSDTATGAMHAFLYTPQQGMRDLATFDANANGINNAGTVVGYAYFPGVTINHAFQYTAAGGMRDLVGPGGPESMATAINAAGQIVGYSGGHAVMWNPDGSLRNLGAPTVSGMALAINNAGQAVGVANDHAVIWNGSAMLDLNTVIDPRRGWVLYYATGINSAGQIAAWGAAPETGGSAEAAFLLTPVPDPATMILMAAGLLGLLSRRSRALASTPTAQY